MPDSTETALPLGIDQWSSSTNAPGVPSQLDSQLPLWERMLEAGVLSLICVTAVVSNISLWLIVLTSRNLRNESNYLILCLSLADLLVSVVSMPITVATIASSGWIFSKKMCTALGYINMLAFVTSVESLGVISINRFVKISYPSLFVDMYTTRSVLLMSAGVWLISGTMSLPPLFGWARYGYLPLASICFCDWPQSPSYAFFMIACCFCVPCGVMTFCYVRILSAYRQSNKTIQSFVEKTVSTPQISDSGVGSTVAASDGVFNVAASVPDAATSDGPDKARAMAIGVDAARSSDDVAGVSNVATADGCHKAKSVDICVAAAKSSDDVAADGTDKVKTVVTNVAAAESIDMAKYDTSYVVGFYADTNRTDLIEAKAYATSSSDVVKADEIDHISVKPDVIGSNVNGVVVNCSVFHNEIDQNSFANTKGIATVVSKVTDNQPDVVAVSYDIAQSSFMKSDSVKSCAMCTEVTKHSTIDSNAVKGGPVGSDMVQNGALIFGVCKASAFVPIETAASSNVTQIVASLANAPEDEYTVDEVGVDVANYYMSNVNLEVNNIVSTIDCSNAVVEDGSGDISERQDVTNPLDSERSRAESDEKRSYIGSSFTHLMKGENDRDNNQSMKAKYFEEGKDPTKEVANLVSSDNHSADFEGTIRRCLDCSSKTDLICSTRPEDSANPFVRERDKELQTVPRRCCNSSSITCSTSNLHDLPNNLDLKNVTETQTPITELDNMNTTTWQNQNMLSVQGAKNARLHNSLSPNIGRRKSVLRSSKSSRSRGHTSKMLVSNTLCPIEEDTVSNFTAENIKSTHNIGLKTVHQPTVSNVNINPPFQTKGKAVSNINNKPMKSSKPLSSNALLPNRIQNFLGAFLKPKRLGNCKVKPITESVSIPSLHRSSEGSEYQFQIQPMVISTTSSSSNSQVRDDKRNNSSTYSDVGVSLVPDKETSAHFSCCNNECLLTFEKQSRNRSTLPKVKLVSMKSAVSANTDNCNNAVGQRCNTINIDSCEEPCTDRPASFNHQNPLLRIPSTEHQQDQTSALQTSISTTAFLSPNTQRPLRSHCSSNISAPKVSSKPPSTRSSKETANERRRRDEIRLTTSLLIVVALFIVCWFPYCISMFLSIYRPNVSGRGLDMTALLLGYMNSCVNPIVYGLMNRRFKEGYRKLFTKCRFRKRLHFN